MEITGLYDINDNRNFNSFRIRFSYGYHNLASLFLTAYFILEHSTQRVADIFDRLKRSATRPSSTVCKHYLIYANLNDDRLYTNQ